MEERILLVEDDEKMAIALKFNLEMEGFLVDHVTSAEAAMKLIPQSTYVLLILDIMLPGISGLELLELFRSHNKVVPIIMTSAKNTSRDIVEALDLGADDYIPKPFDLKIFLAKVTAVLRARKIILDSNPPMELGKYEFGSNWIDFTTSLAGHKESSFRLSYKETMIMKLLIENEGEAVNRDEFWKQVWGTASSLNSRTLDNFMYQLRKRFENKPSKPVHILKAHGEGYRFIKDGF